MNLRHYSQSKRTLERSFPNLENRANSRVEGAKMKTVRRSLNTQTTDVASFRGQSLLQALAY